MQFVRILLIGVTILTASWLVVRAADQKSASSKQAPPPTQWDRRVTDTFFSDARTALTGERPATLSFSAVKGNGGGKSGDSTTTGANAAATPGSDVAGWSKRISADTLQDEVKALAPMLADSVKTQQAFLGGGSKKARQSLSVLAALFAVANEYDAEVKWKAQAAAARDVFAKGGFNCKAATEQTFREAKNCNEDLLALIRGESIKPPAGLEPKTDWGKVANLAPLMNRLELGQRDRISAAMASAAQFKKDTTTLSHESEIITAIAEMISRPGMENADDEKFRGFAQALQQSGLDVRKAVTDGNYDAARTAAGAMTKVCANCHAEFR